MNENTQEVALQQLEHVLVSKPGYDLDPKANFFLKLISGIFMYIMFFMFVIADFLAWSFQAVYFTTFKMTKVKRSDYVIIDRHKLKKLNLPQKIACVYCGYANGVISWIKAILIQIEIYSCAIKHKTKPLGQPHIEEENYFDYEYFE